MTNHESNPRKGFINCAFCILNCALFCSPLFGIQSSDRFACFGLPPHVDGSLGRHRHRGHGLVVVAFCFRPQQREPDALQCGQRGSVQRYQPLLRSLRALRPASAGLPSERCEPKNRSRADRTPSANRQIRMKSELASATAPNNRIGSRAGRTPSAKRIDYGPK